VGWRLQAVSKSPQKRASKSAGLAFENQPARPLPLLRLSAAPFPNRVVFIPLLLSFCQKLITP
jgi:hypothetical protein